MMHTSWSNLVEISDMHFGREGPVAYPGFFGGEAGSTNSVEDRGRGPVGGSPLVRDSGGSCNLGQEI